MKSVVFFAITSAAAAVSIQEVVDDLFDKYLPQKATWEEVKACRTKCNEDQGCLASCPQFESPCKRVIDQCELFNSTRAKSKECHIRCEHDFACHFNCPMAKLTTIRELKVLGEAMVCHTQCGHDHACHKACHNSSNPWHVKQASCEKLDAVVTCMRSGGSHSTCPHLDEETQKYLFQEPWSLVKDLGNHVAEHLLPLPEGQELSVEEVRACHVACRADAGCHKRCPKGVFGRFADKCEMLEEASTCHHACEHSQTKCPFKKTECHFKCPMSMPNSVGELKGLLDHVLCHTTCGQDKECHQTCPNSNWDEKKTQCAQYDEMVDCHKVCAGVASCHAACPHLTDHTLNQLKEEPSNLIKDIVNILV